MNAIVSLINGVAVTTSFAISEGTETEHASVIKLVRTYLSDLEEFGGVGFEIAPFETAGGMQHREIATLNEQQSTLILTYMRNSEIVRAFKKRLVREFYSLRQAQIDPMQVLNDPAAMRGLLLNYSEKVMVLQKKVDEQEPKVLAFENIKGAHGALCFRDTAKTIPVKEARLKLWLLANKWAYTRPGKGRLIGTSEAQAKGYVNHKLTTRTFEDGSIEEYAQMMITPRGVARLALEFSRGGLAA